MIIRVILSAICWLLLFLLVNPCWADLTGNRSQLEQIRVRIERAEINLQNNKKSELNISRELVLVKNTLEKIERRIDEQKTKLKKLQGEIEQQEKLVKESQKGIKRIVSQLEKRLVVLYKEGDTGPLKILFSADSPTEMAQQYHYLNRVLQYDKELLAEYRQAIEEQQQSLLGLKSLGQQQTELLEKNQEQRQIAVKGRRLQTRLLKQARAEKTKLADELVELKENAVRLKSLIARLEQEPASTTGPVAGNFAVGRGKLGWPVNGRVVIGFGQQKDAKLGTYYESNGIEVAVAPGSSIRAVAAGKVVFADYFKGYGNLFILSHPGGYHTLYAQTDRMQKKLGDQISAGDLLGHSGLSGRESIYFEIRSNGSPVNPLSWLKRH
ncbi:MAG: peptidoglycan DD-metalloendopeptidase family protein [Desulfuromusa sp.]|jgi:septal ring factor EnvC (AmiA/AmiB activator)|nr:peptidoglycan DD-metalloendopeptidase family protein [Desulfuromusa sp.]